LVSKTFKGRVITIQRWGSGKGYFVRLDTTDEDLYKFGQPRFDTDIDVTIQAEPGNNRFSDKWEIKKMTLAGGEEIPTKDVTPPKELPTIEQATHFEKKAENRETAIRRAVALKAAVVLEAGMIVPEAEPDMEKTIAGVLLTAKEFEKYLIVR